MINSRWVKVTSNFYLFLEKTRMKHLLRGSSWRSNLVLKPKLDNCAGHQTSNMKKQTKVTVYIISVLVNDLFSPSNLKLQSDCKIILYYDCITAQILRANKQSWDEASRCGDSHVLSQNPIGPRVTSCLYIRLSTNQGPEKPELRLKKNLDSCRHR